MQFLKSTLGYFLAATIINGFWSFFINKFGSFGAYGAALFLTGTMWYINHYLGLIKHEEDSAFVDMALGVAISLLTKNYMVNGLKSFVYAIHNTFVWVTVGAVLGGLAAVLVEKKLMEASSKKDNYEVINSEMTELKEEV